MKLHVEERVPSGVFDVLVCDQATGNNRADRQTAAIPDLFMAGSPYPEATTLKSALPCIRINRRMRVKLSGRAA
jgi:hypothetical protein